MNYKITAHLMPWELDYALLSFTQLKKSKYYLNSSDQVFIDVTLNLSSYIINWKESKIPKEFFINKFENLQSLLKDYNCHFKIYDGDQLYGGLNAIYESTEDHIDHYIVLNPDMYFSEDLLCYLIEGSKQIKNEYFVITPQIPKLWDNTWDSISHPNFSSTAYKDWNNLDAYDVRYFMKNLNENITLTPLNKHKWAGWCDLYSKKTWEEFYSIKDWNGYGPVDFYSMLLSQYAKDKGLDFQQYILRSQTIGDYWIGNWKKEDGLSGYYKKFIVKNEIPSQRAAFEGKMITYIEKGLQMLKQKGII
jgi:hypothetical protein